MIDQIEIVPVAVPLRRPHKMAVGTVHKLESIIIQVRTSDGVVGIGEAAPSPFVSHETRESVLAALSKYLGPWLIGKDPFNIEATLGAFARLMKGNSFAKAAIDLACHDILGKVLGVPAYNLLGGKVRDEIPLSWSLASSDVKADLDEAHDILRREGVTTFKIKAGVLRPKEDVYRIRKIREVLGDDIDLRVDANQAWTPEVAVSVIKEIEECNITFVEQPVPGWNLDGMRRVASDVTVPIMVDEGLLTPDDALRHVVSGAADILGIKVMKHGGLRGSKKIAAIAEAAGLSCYLGSRMALTVCAAASVHFGISTHEIRYGCEEFCDLLTEDVIAVNPVSVKNGSVQPFEGKGLGVELDPVKIARYQVGERVIVR